MAALDRLRGLPLLGLLTVCWGLFMRQFGEQEIYATVGGYALFVSAVVLLIYRREVPSWFRFGLREAAIGVGMGALMTGLTYPLYRLAAALLPSLSVTVATLYRSSDERNLGLALCWVFVILSAEELLFRGAFLVALERHMSRPTALCVSTLAYAAAQAFSGSLLVGLLALCCGSVWAIERMLTGSLVAPLLSHMVWTPVVILLCPVMD